MYHSGKVLVGDRTVISKGLRFGVLEERECIASRVEEPNVLKPITRALSDSNIHNLSCLDCRSCRLNMVRRWQMVLSNMDRHGSQRRMALIFLILRSRHGTTNPPIVGDCGSNEKFLTLLLQVSFKDRR